MFTVPATAPFSIAGRPSGDGADMQAIGPDGDVAMTARVEFTGNGGGA